jgi:hypothetical protein
MSRGSSIIRLPTKILCTDVVVVRVVLATRVLASIVVAVVVVVAQYLRRRIGIPSEYATPDQRSKNQEAKVA